MCIRDRIEATEDGIDISDYESEDTYRFLANETNVKNEEENKVYLEYPAQVLSLIHIFGKSNPWLQRRFLRFCEAECGADPEKNPLAPCESCLLYTSYPKDR